MGARMGGGFGLSKCSPLLLSPVCFLFRYMVALILLCLFSMLGPFATFFLIRGAYNLSPYVGSIFWGLYCLPYEIFTGANMNIDMVMLGTIVRVACPGICKGGGPNYERIFFLLFNFYGGGQALICPPPLDTRLIK